VPGSKSYTNRALYLSGLADGTSNLEGALFSDDTLHMVGALRELGITVHTSSGLRRLTVDGCGGRIPNAQARLSVGNAGTAVRFLTALTCLGHGTYEIDGNDAMRTRPMGPMLAALRALGGDVVSAAGNDCPPIRVAASGLAGGEATLSGSVSSQYTSALLMCAPYTDRGMTLTLEGELVSKPYLDMTVQAMGAFGVEVFGDPSRGYRVEGGQRYRATSYAVEPDASAASYFFAAAAITRGRVIVSGLGKSSLQGDLGFVRILERMGCRVRQTETETEVTGVAELSGVEVDMRDLSDTAQTLAAVAPFARSPTRITGIGFIRRKETDRIAAVVRELNRLGISALEEPDGIYIPPGEVRPARVETYDDHRMAMSFAVMGLRSPGITVADPHCVGKTFPDFFQVLDSLTVGGNASMWPRPLDDDLTEDGE
jgi:3-phosphoshikimate 1-carboxyvinyltransferase